MVEHAPTPWQIGIALYPYVHFYGPSDKAGGALAVGACVTALGKEYDEANAAFIVKAVNEHAALVARIEYLEATETNKILRLRQALEDARRDLLALRPRSDTGSLRKRQIEACADRIEEVLNGPVGNAGSGS